MISHLEIEIAPFVYAQQQHLRDPVTYDLDPLTLTSWTQTGDL